MVEILARDAAKVSYLLCVPFERGGAVDEQVATLALEQKGPDLERGAKPQGLGHRSVETGDHVFHQTPSSCGLLDALLWWDERGLDTSGEGTVFGLDLRTGFTREHSGNGAGNPATRQQRRGVPVYRPGGD